MHTLDEVAICNMALAHILSQDSVSSLDPPDETPAGKQCSLFYPVCRDLALTDYPWGFATKHIQLALVDTDVVTNWGFCYAYPSDCLDAQYLVVAGTRKPTLEDSLPYVIENYNGQIVILCDVEDAELVYTAQITNTLLYPPRFSMALSYLIASMIAGPLAKPELVVPMQELYGAVSMQAAGQNMNEQQIGPPAACSLERARE